MLFKPELIDKIKSGEKTQTRRIKKAGEWLIELDGGGKIVFREPATPKWETGKTYAICPGRGKAAVGRFLLLDIREERVKDISESDAIAEGAELNHYHCDVGVAPDYFYIHHCDPIGKFLELFVSINGKAALDKEVWVLVFERVKSE